MIIALNSVTLLIASKGGWLNQGVAKLILTVVVASVAPAAFSWLSAGGGASFQLLGGFGVVLSGGVMFLVTLGEVKGD